MNLIFATLSMAFFLSVGMLALGTIASLVAIFFGYPAGWAIATALLCSSFASNGLKGLVNPGMGGRGIRNNAEGAFGLLHISVLVMVVSFAISELPHQVSAWWALLLPLLLVPSFAVQWFFEFVLDVINPGGRRIQ